MQSSHLPIRPINSSARNWMPWRCSEGKSSRYIMITHQVTKAKSADSTRCSRLAFQLVAEPDSVSLSIRVFSLLDSERLLTIYDQYIYRDNPDAQAKGALGRGNTRLLASEPRCSRTRSVDCAQRVLDHLAKGESGS